MQAIQHSNSLSRLSEKKKFLAAHKASVVSPSAIERPSGVGEALTSRDPLLLSAGKRKAVELSRSECYSDSTSLHPAPENQFDNGPEAQGTTGEHAAMRSTQHGPTEGRLVYGSVVAGVASVQQPSGPHMFSDKDSFPTELADSAEASPRHMSAIDMSGPLCGMPDGTTPYAQVVTNTTAPAAERQNETPIYVTGVMDTSGFLSWLHSSCQSGVSANIKGEKLMLVPCTAEGFRTTVSTLGSLDRTMA